jgi:hypothetical protein
MASTRGFIKILEIPHHGIVLEILAFYNIAALVECRQEQQVCQPASTCMIKSGPGSSGWDGSGGDYLHFLPCVFARPVNPGPVCTMDLPAKTPEFLFAKNRPDSQSEPSGTIAG